VEKAFKLEPKNRFSALDNTATEDHDNIQEKRNTIKKTYVEAAVNTIGYRTKKNKEWSTSETWKQIEEWKNNKLRMINAKSIRLQKQLKTACTIKDKEVKRSGRRYRRTFIDNLAHEAEHAASHGEMSTAYKITKQLNQVKKLALILLRKTYILT